MIWKVEAQGDTIYFKEETLKDAERKFKDFFGEVPKKLVTWTEVDELPDGIEPI